MQSSQVRTHDIWVLAALWVILNAADVWLTQRAILQQVGWELNPLLSPHVNSWAVMLKAPIGLGIVVGLSKVGFNARTMLAALVIGMIVIVVWNWVWL